MEGGGERKNPSSFPLSRPTSSVKGGEERERGEDGKNFLFHARRKRRRKVDSYY